MVMQKVAANREATGDIRPTVKYGREEDMPKIGEITADK